MKNELRIGNWVQFKYTETPVRITLGDFVREYKDEHLDDYEPIQLSEEWLERFGWVKSKDRNYFWHDSNLSLWFNDNGLFIESVGGKLYIKHLHQLQNLYHALTGEELQTDETEQIVNQ